AQIATLPTERRQRAEQAAQRVLDKYARQAIQHEAAHAIQFNIGLFDRSGDVPSWLAEGLAQAFELWEPGVDDVLSRVHTERAAKFRRMYATPADLPNLSRLIADDASWQPSRDDAMAWALVHYLWQARRAEFTEYVQRMSRRGEEKLTARQRLAEFADVFGPPDGVFGERLHAHILGLQTERTP
ncbi:MAG: DUF1570 domain-containing protein, partial [Phycisphaerae bacterium]|nr:DUF1570 domain-containing protein [Phycisphaerae bacterium]